MSWCLHQPVHNIVAAALPDVFHGHPHHRHGCRLAYKQINRLLANKLASDWQKNTGDVRYVL